MTSLSRRELLNWLLGASIAAGACKKKQGNRTNDIDAAFVFEDQKLGHRLTQNGLGKPEQFLDIDVAIVGAGVAGLSAAQMIHRNAPGLNVRVFNIGKNVGGTARHGKSQISEYPWGAHYVTAPTKENRAFVNLLDEAGALESTSPDGEPIFKEEQLCREPEERVFFKGRWVRGLYRTEGQQRLALQERERFEKIIDHWANHPDRPFAIPTGFGRQTKETLALDNISAKEWCIKNGFKSESFRWWVDYSCRDDFGARATSVSAWALLHYFASRRRKGKYADVVTWPEGNGRLIKTLNRGLSDKTTHQALVYDINQVEGNQIEVSVLSQERLLGFRSKQVIVCTPQFIANRIVRKRQDEFKETASLLHYSPWLVANLKLNERPSWLGAEPAWDNVIYDSPSLGYVVSTHQKGTSFGPTHWTYYFPLAEDDLKAERKRLLSLSAAEWSEVILSDLERAHPDLRQKVERIDMARYGHGMLRPTPGLRPHLSKMAKSRGDIHFAGADLSGLPLFEEAFDKGRVAGINALKRLGKEALVF